MEIATGKLLGRRVQLDQVRPTPPGAGTAKGFFYSRYEKPKAGAEFQALNFNNSFATTASARRSATTRWSTIGPSIPSGNTRATVTEDGRYLVITTALGTDDRYRITVKDLTRAVPRCPSS